MRKVKFANNEYYHIFNRGVDKRSIFMEDADLKRFFQSMKEFSALEPIGSIYENRFHKTFLEDSSSKKGRLVDFICYCLNPNHYHFILEQLVERGVEKFMQRLGIGYTMYFNKKNKRSGVLFQGKYKAIHVDSNEYLLHLSAYVNLNYKVHNFRKLGDRISKLRESSWNEYIEDKNDFCKKDIILEQFENVQEYKKFAENSLKEIKERKEIKRFLLE